MSEALFKQDRHPNGITERDIEWAKNVYYDRLLRGCIFRCLLTRLDGTPTRYASVISDIVRYRVTKDSMCESRTKIAIEAEMIKDAQERYNEVIECWRSQGFSGYASYDWANALVKEPRRMYRENICVSVVGDALAYIDLVFDWPVFVRAIKRLSFVGHGWLFEDISVEAKQLHNHSSGSEATYSGVLVSSQ